MVWKPSWLQDPDKKEDDKKNDLPPELDQRFKDLNEQTKKDVTSILDERLKGLDSITAFIEDQIKEKEKKKDLPPPDPNKGKTREEINAEFVQRFADDPLGALREAMTPTEQALLLTRADNVKREVFTDRADEFPYYTGDFKREIDEILGKQTLQFRNDPTAVANVYYTVLGKRQKEVEEGKIKSRFASSHSPVSKGADDNRDEKKPLVMTEDMKRAAKLMGFTEDQYKEILQKEDEVNV